MAFTARTYGSDFPNPYTDADVYQFHEGGVLEIHLTDSGKRVYYAPHKWDLIEADDNHGPGSPSGKYDVGKSVL